MKSLWRHIGIVLCIAVFALLCYQRFWLYSGLPSGHDIMFELSRILDYRHALLTQYLPRMAVHTYAFGGSPDFVFYAPLFLFLTSAVSLLVGPLLAVKVVVAGMSIFSATCAFYLLKRKYSLGGAIFGTATYLTMPYVFYDVFVRNAFAEFMGMLLIIPVLLAVDLVLSQASRGKLIFLYLMVLCLLLSHNITIMLGTPLLVGYLLWLWYQRRTSRQVVYTLLAALGTASCFLFPAFFEKVHVHTSELLQGKFEVFRNFISLGPDVLTVGGVAWWTPLMIGLLILGVLMFSKERIKGKSREILVYLIGISILLLVMLPMSTLLWKYIPLLKFVQFPWRLQIFMVPLFTLLAGLLYARSGIIIRILLLGLLAWHLVIMGLHYLPENASRTFGSSQLDALPVDSGQLRLTVGSEYEPNPDYYDTNMPSISPGEVKRYSVGGIYPAIGEYCGTFSEGVLFTFPYHYFPYLFVEDEQGSLQVNQKTKYLTVYPRSGEHCLRVVLGFTPLEYIALLVSLFGILGMMVIVVRQK